MTLILTSNPISVIEKELKSLVQSVLWLICHPIISSKVALTFLLGQYHWQGWMPYSWHLIVWFSWLICPFSRLSDIIILVQIFQWIARIFSTDSWMYFMKFIDNIMSVKHKCNLYCSRIMSWMIQQVTYIFLERHVPCNPLTFYFFNSWSKSLCPFLEVYVVRIRFCPTSSPCAAIPRIIATNCQCTSEMKILISP